MARSRIKVTFIDIIALLVLVIGFILIGLEKDGEIKAMMGMVLGFYFRGKVKK